MEELDKLRQRLEEERPAAWDAMPDLALYMDQVISYLPRQHIRFDGSEGITSAMVNNYMKDGLLPRAEGKRYHRTHLAYLTVIAALKQVLSVKDMADLISVGQEGKEPELLYNAFLQELDGALNATAEMLGKETKEEDLPRLAMTLALRSYADRLACQRVLELIRPEEPEDKKRKK